MTLFDQSAQSYDSWYETPTGAYIDAIQKELINEVAKPQFGETALDLGCGTGIYSIWLAQQGLAVTGVDISTEMLKIAMQKTTKENLAINYLRADLKKLPFDDESFDLAICNLVLEFVESPEEVIAEALRVVKKGGRLVIGFIGKHSEWAQLYKINGKKNPDSVFAKAMFYDSQSIQQFSPIQPASIRFGLYSGPKDFDRIEYAQQIEQQQKLRQQEQGAGYITAKWEKK